MRAAVAAAGRRAYRYGRRFAVTIGVIVAVLVVSTLTLDLGPALRARAETEGGKWLERKMTIGRLGVHLGSGRFVVEDLRIDGMFPNEPPWLVAKRIDVSLKWSALLHREVLLDIDRDDRLEDGRRVVSRRPPDVSASDRTAAHAAHRTAARRHHDAVRARAPRRAGVQRLRIGLARGRAQSRGDRRPRPATIAASSASPTAPSSIQKYEPMTADMTAGFKFVDGKIVFDRINLITDGAVSDMTGVVDLRNWPEQLYQIKSTIQFPKQREIFFARDKFTLFGEGHFTGTFHMFKGGRELKGDFTSALAGVNDYRFPNLEGSVVWVRDRMEVTRATADFYGGKADFKYLMAPLGKRDQPARAVFDVNYRDVDLNALTDFYEMRGLRLAGRASGHNEMSWPLGRYAERRGSGTATFTSVGGLQGPQLAADAAADARDRYLIAGPFSTHTPLAPVAVAGDVTYAFDPEAIRFEPSRIFTEDTYIAFEGATAYGERSKMPFRVTSRNWQESDRFLAGIMTAFGAPTRAIPIDGVGKFDGVMLGAFRRPRIEGRFTGSEMRAWDVNWGDDRRRLRRRKLVRQHQPRGDPQGPVADGRDRAVLARLSARRRRRADSMRASASPSGRSPISARPSICRTTTSTACCPATSTSTATTKGRTASAA